MCVKFEVNNTHISDVIYINVNKRKNMAPLSRILGILCLLLIRICTVQKRKYVQNVKFLTQIFQKSVT